MRYWFDTEFQDTGRTIELISIGVVAEDGREYYAVSAEYDAGLADEWLRKNVLPKLGDAPKKSRKDIHLELQGFFSQGGTPEFWADCGEYDWIVLRQLFGVLIEWPQGWPYLAMDIEQWRIQSGAPKFPPQVVGLHNALADAKNAQQRWQWLQLGVKSGIWKC
ncbi:MAG: 3'-5' exoribonuclease [Gallionella sp.]|jgi:hypothetical protein